MKVYVWHRLDNVSAHWHTEGGLLVCAADKAEARALVAQNNEIELPASFSPDVTYDVDAGEPRVMVFPDAGCC